MDVVLFCVCVSDVVFLYVFCDKFLSGDFGWDLETGLWELIFVREHVVLGVFSIKFGVM